MREVADPMMNRFKVGDIVRFVLEDKDMYSFNVPKLGTIGVVEMQTHSFGVEEMLGVKIPMSIVLWSDGQTTSVFSHDINKVEATKERKKEITTLIKSITPYTGKNNN